MKFWMLTILSVVFIIVGLGLCVEGVILHNWEEAFWASITAIAGMGTFVYVASIKALLDKMTIQDKQPGEPGTNERR